MAELGASESTHRFQQQVLAFLESVASEENPLVLILDDLQWAGAASLGLLKLMLLEGPQKGFGVVISYRNKEIGSGTPVAQTLAELISKLEPLQTTLTPLSVDDVLAFLLDSLGKEGLELKPLARLIHQHSKGNPFVARQLVHRMHRDGLLTFDDPLRTWVWDIEKISESSHSDDIVEIVADDIGRLSS